MDHAYVILKTYFTEVADLLDEKFNLAYNMTYMT